MEHLKKFNESVENQIPTYSQLLNMINDDNNIQYINIDDKKHISKFINRMIELSKGRGRDILDLPICNIKSFNRGLTDFQDFCIVFDNGQITAIIGEYELTNSFIFGDVVICPGHDSITCYNKVTRESTTSYIR